SAAMQGIFAGFGVKRRALAGLAAAVAIAAVVSGVLLMRRARHGGGPAPSDGGVALGRFGVAGRVVDRLGRPLGGARVTARVGQGNPVVANTDGDGRYVLRLASAAAARLRVEAEGFVAEELGG